MTESAPGPLLEVEGLTVTFPSPQGPLTVVKGISFRMGRENTVLPANAAPGERIAAHLRGPKHHD